MRLFKILVKHYGPKDSHGAIEGFLLRRTEEEVCDYVMTKLGLMDEEDLSCDVVEVYDEAGNYVGMVTKREEILRNHGEINLDSNDYSDAHYGITHYGWEDLGEPKEFEVLTLERLGLFVDKSEEDEE